MMSTFSVAAYDEVRKPCNPLAQSPEKPQSFSVSGFWAPCSRNPAEIGLYQTGGNGMYDLTHTFETKTFIGGVVVIISYIAKSLDEVFVVLAAFMIIDYITGILCGLFRNGGFNYKKAVRGIVKKLLFLVLILITILLEFLINFLTVNAGLLLRVEGAITTAMYIYLIGTEGLSIIQNLIILGIPVPPFMVRLLGLIRDEYGNLIKK